MQGTRTRTTLALTGLGFLLATALAGCVGPGGPGPGPAAGADPSDASDRVSDGAPSVAAFQEALTGALGLTPTGPAAVYADCYQQHLHFDARVDDLAPLVPAGLTVLPKDPAGLITEFVVTVSDCAGAALATGTDAHAPGPTREMWFQVPVTPDEPAHEVADHTHRFVVDLFVDGAPSETTLEAWGLSDLVTPARLDVTHEDGPVAPSSSVLARAPGAEYQLESHLAPGSATFPGHLLVLWFGTPADGLVARTVVHETDATTVGSGWVGFVSNGAEGAPPATVGIAHEVDGLSWVAAPVGLGGGR